MLENILSSLLFPKYQSLVTDWCSIILIFHSLARKFCSHFTLNNFLKPQVTIWIKTNKQQKLISNKSEFYVCVYECINMHLYVYVQRQMGLWVLHYCRFGLCLIRNKKVISIWFHSHLAYVQYQRSCPQSVSLIHKHLISWFNFKSFPEMCAPCTMTGLHAVTSPSVCQVFYSRMFV